VTAKMAMRFRTLEWLFPVALHNTEEALWLPAWSIQPLFELAKALGF